MGSTSCYEERKGKTKNIQKKTEELKQENELEILELDAEIDFFKSEIKEKLEKYEKMKSTPKEKNIFSEDLEEEIMNDYNSLETCLALRKTLLNNNIIIKNNTRENRVLNKLDKLNEIKEINERDKNNEKIKKNYNNLIRQKIIDQKNLKSLKEGNNMFKELNKIKTNEEGYNNFKGDNKKQIDDIKKALGL